MSKVLVIGAHMDDEVLGCGGTILKHIKNKDKVYACFMTDSSSTQYVGDLKKLKIKYEQAREVQKLLKIKDIFFLDFPDMKLDTIPIAEVSKKLSEVVNKIKPDIVYTHCKNDLNKDHRITFEATLVATRPASSTVKKILSYEILSSTELGLAEFKPTTYVEINNFIRQKKIAFLKYKDEIRQYPNPRSTQAIEILARKRGLEIGKTHAEAFELIRDIK